MLIVSGFPEGLPMAKKSGIEYLRKIYVKLRKIYLSNFFKVV